MDKYTEWQLRDTLLELNTYRGVIETLINDKINPTLPERAILGIWFAVESVIDMYVECAREQWKSIFYNDIIVADTYHNLLKNTKIGSNEHNQSFEQYKWAINDAFCRQFPLENKLEYVYNISPSDQPNRYRISESQKPVCS